MRRSMLVIFGTVVAGAGFASPAMAHGDHASCSEGVRTIFVPMAQAGQLDDFVLPIARSGAAAETIEATMAAICEPRP